MDVGGLGSTIGKAGCTIRPPILVDISVGADTAFFLEDIVLHVSSDMRLRRSRELQLIIANWLPIKYSAKASNKSLRAARIEEVHHN
jgi:hypothetical protein